MPSGSTGLGEVRLAGGRYVLQREIGAGSMGQVFVARDTVLDREVALKMLRRRNADELYHLKQEFRALADLRHPNLVVLHDLVVQPECPFFTMELLDAIDLVSYVRGADRSRAPGPPAAGGWQRLRASLPQLLAGLEALHSTGRLHRDIKPSNILVTRDGRVVLIDFGLAVLPSLTSDHATDQLAGTFAYMAAELLRGEQPSVASDCYALGVTLFEALTGELPIGERDMLDLSRAPPPCPTPRARVPEAPVDLSAITEALLRHEPALRPSYDALRSMLEAQASPLPVLPVPSTASLWQAPFVDREESLAALHSALRDAAAGKPVTIHVAGPSGIGKSALIRRFIDQAREESTFVLASRCYPQESVPFKALDGFVDGLSEMLNRPEALEQGEPESESANALLRVFPVLGRVPALARGVDAEATRSEPEETRRIAFRALGDLLCRVASQRRLILWIDDLQWGDLDSAVFLRMLMQLPKSPPLLMILSYRSAEWETSDIADALRGDDGIPIGRRIDLEALPADHARSLVAGLVAGGGPIDTAYIDAIARESGGNPFLLCEIARFCAARLRSAVEASTPTIPVGSINEIVRSRLLSLDTSARRLLSAVAVAGGPCVSRVAGSAAGLGRELDDAVAALRKECLLRDSTAGEESRVETFHDRIREAVVDLLAAGERREYHLGLAAALEQEPDTDPILLVQHYHGGGDDERAGRTAKVAAQRAFAALAFEQAARLYEFALRVGTDDSQRWELLRGRADALAQAGRGGEAGPTYREAARALATREPGSGTVQELTRMAAEQLLRSGYIEEGTTALREVLRSVGEPYPRTPGRAVLDLAQHRLLLMLRGLRYRERKEQEVSPTMLRRIDALWGAAVGLVWADSIRSAAFHGRHTRLALNAGEPTRVVRALCTEAVFHAAIASRWALRRAERALRAAEHLSSELDSPFVTGLTAVCAGGAAYFAGRFPEGYAHSARAEEILRTRCTGVAWELTNAHIFTSWALTHMGDLDRLRETIPSLLERARGRGDLLEYCCLLAGIPTSMRLLAEGKPGEVQRAVREAVASWPTRDFQLPAYFGLVSATLADLYAGEPLAAWKRISDAAPTVRSVRLLDFRLVRVEFRQLHTRCGVLALAKDRSIAAGERSKMRRSIARSIRQIEREDMPWASPLAAALSASTAAATGDVSAAREFLRQAATGFEAASMSLWAAAARHQAGLREGTQWMNARGVADPERYAEMMIPIRTISPE